MRMAVGSEGAMRAMNVAAVNRTGLDKRWGCSRVGSSHRGEWHSRADDDDGMSEAAHEARETAGRLGQGADVGEQSSRQFYAQQLSTPEWMVAVPPDLRHHWYAPTAAPMRSTLSAHSV